MTTLHDCFQPDGKGGVRADKAALRKFVTSYLGKHWGWLKTAFANTKAPIDKSRLRPGDISQRMPILYLKAIALRTVSVNTMISALANAGDDTTDWLGPHISETVTDSEARGVTEDTIFGPVRNAVAMYHVPLALMDAGQDPLRAQALVGALTGDGPQYVTGMATGTNRWEFKDGINAQTITTGHSARSFAQLLDPSAEFTPYERRYIAAVATACGIKIDAPANTTTTTTPEKQQMQIEINPTVATLVNSVLGSANLPKIEDLLEAQRLKDSAVSQLKAAEAKANRTDAELAELRTKLATAATAVNTAPVAASGTWPGYRIETKSAADLFAVPAKFRAQFDVPMPCIEWDGPMPASVPAIDPDYVIRPNHLLSCIYAIVTNTNIVATGETGTGKTTLFEQVAARMKFPVEVINLDSEITRMDIMGRDTLKTEGGQSITVFEEGIVPRAMQRPGFLILDEFDFGRPDVMYAIQRLLTGSGLTLTEDGGRFIAPHPMFRIAATGNTKGQGDESGFYQGARIQSAAFLNRFGVWLEVDYLGADSVETVLAKRLPAVDPKVVSQTAKYTVEHQRAFKNRTVTTPFSMRDAHHLARSIGLFLGLLPKDKAIERAIAQTVLDRASDTDAATLRGIADRIFA